MVANPATFAACLEFALNVEEAEGETETAVIHVLNDTMPQYFKRERQLKTSPRG